MIARALADTSVFIADERGWEPPASFPDELSVSVVTVGELRAGVLSASDPLETARRLRTLNVAEMLEPLAIDLKVADAWSELRVALVQAGRRLGINDSWIAATAIANRLPILSLDSDFEGVPGLEIIT